MKSVQSAAKLSSVSFPPWLLAGLLVLVTVVVYWPTVGHDFVSFDDYMYVTENPHVTSGLTLGNAAWAFRSGYAANWHPITWLSHMLDCQLFGLKPGWHHLTNALLHALNAGLVFALLRQMTGAAWRSLLVAALFAFHPLRVESVAWVAERKDVLSAFFGLLALIAYARYAQGAVVGNQWPVISGQWSVGSGQSSGVPATYHVPRTTGHGPLITDHRLLFYFLSLLFFALGLMSKPMLVTLPFVMLLLDYWPLGRIKKAEVRGQRSEVRGEGAELAQHASRSTAQSQIANRKSQILFPRLLEKLPFFVLAALASVVTLLVQQHGGAMTEAENLPLGVRSGNALVSYGRYLAKLFWPVNLVPYYPHPGHLPLGKVVLAVLVLGGISLLVLWLAGLHGLAAVQRDEAHRLSDGPLTPALSPSEGEREGRRPHLGARARRTSPTDGLRGSLAPAEGERAGVRGLSGECRSMERGRGWLIVGWLWFLGTLVPVIGLVQVGQQAMADRYTYFPSLGVLLLAVWSVYELVQGKAEVSGQRSEVGDTLHAPGPNRKSQILLWLVGGVALVLCFALTRQQLAHWKDSESLFRHMLVVNQKDALAHNNLGIALGRKGRLDEAIPHLREAVRLQPEYAEAHNNLGIALDEKGQVGEAIIQYREAIRLKPDYADAHYNLGTLLLLNGRLDEAIHEFQEALRLNPNHAEAQYYLQQALGRKSQFH